MTVEDMVYSKYLNGYTLEEIQDTISQNCNYWWMEMEAIENIIDQRNSKNEIW